jgi:hypothetical protein
VAGGGLIMGKYRVPPPRTAKKRFSISIDKSVYESIRSEATATKRSMASVFNERLRRDDLLTEIRKVIREELNK